MSDRRAFGRIDIFRMVAAVMVVAIHTYPFADMSRTLDFVFTHVICRVAVPFFFMTSGYFLISHYAKSTQKLAEFIKKTLIIYAVAILIYIPVNVYSGYFSADTNFLQDVIFNGTMYHLWYLPASVMGSCIAWYLVRKLDYGWALAISAVLYVLGLLGDSYYGITESAGFLKAAYDALFRVFEYTRNGLFFAPIFFILGGFAAEKGCDGKGSEKLLLVLFVDLMIGEGLLLNLFGNQRHDSMYIFLVPTVWYLFMLLLKGGSRRKETLSRASLVMYIIHPMVIVGVRLIAKIIGLESVLTENNLVHFIAVAVISAVFAILWAELNPVRRKEKQLRAWKELDLEALKHNAEVLQRLCRCRCEIMAVVKADAYGHGAYDVAVCLEKSGINSFAVATIDEGIELRKFGIHGEILVLGYTEPIRAGEMHKYRLTQAVVSFEHAKELSEINKAIDVYIKIDTGMHRLGFDAKDIESILKCFEMKNLNVTGVFSHLCVSDETDEENAAFTRAQISAFKRVAGEIKKNAADIKTHLQSSYGLLNYPDVECDYVRVGIALYGVHSSAEFEAEADAELQPVLKLKAKVAQIKTVSADDTVGYGRCYRAKSERKIATVTVGYADGIPRNFSGNVTINGCTAPVVGRVCMDQLSVDVTDVSNVNVGDIVTLIGDSLTAETMAENTGTITNELLSRLGKRLETVIK